MEGRKFSSSRSVVIYVRDVLERYGADPLRYYLAAAGPETSDTDFTWDQFVTRNNTELVAGWGNLVNRTLSMVEKNVGSIPGPGELLGADLAALQASKDAFGPVGALLERSQQKAALAEVMRVVAEANKYLSDQAPWKLKDDPARRETVLHTALQLVDDAKTLLTPVPAGEQRRGAPACSAARTTWSGQPELREVDDLDGGPSYPVLTGDYDTAAVWESRPLRVGHRVDKPVPLFAQARAVGRRRGAGAARGRGVSKKHRNGARDDSPPPAPEPLAVPVARRALPPRHHERGRPARCGVATGPGDEQVAGRSPRPRRSASTRSCRSASTCPPAAGRRTSRPRFAEVHAAVAVHPNEAGARRGHRRGAARDRGAGRAAAGGGGRGDRARPLPDRDGRGAPAAGGVVPRAPRRSPSAPGPR